MKDSPINLDSSAKINLNADVKDVIKLMNISDNGVGFVVSDRNKLIGVITDGDLRRGMNRYENINQLNISEIMTPDPVSVTPETSLITAHRLLTKHKITSLPVVNKSGLYLGFIDTHAINKELSPERIYPLPDGKDPDHNTERHFARYRFAATFIQSDDVVLDCACGAGYGTAILAENASSVLGVDISDHSINFARDTYLRRNTHYQCSDLTELSFSDNSFSLITTMETLEHIESSVCREFLLKTKNWLKPGGVLVASTPMLRYKNNKPYITNPYHINEMPKAEMINLYNELFEGFVIQFFHQKQSVFLPLTSEDSGFCIIVVRKPEN